MAVFGQATDPTDDLRYASFQQKQNLGQALKRTGLEVDYFNDSSMPDVTADQGGVLDGFSSQDKVALGLAGVNTLTNIYSAYETSKNNKFLRGMAEKNYKLAINQYNTANSTLNSEIDRRRGIAEAGGVGSVAENRYKNVGLDGKRVKSSDFQG